MAAGFIGITGLTGVFGPGAGIPPEAAAGGFVGVTGLTGVFGAGTATPVKIPAFLPARMNLRSIEFEVLDRQRVVLDSDFDEPIGGDLRGQRFTVDGQYNFRGGPFKRRSTRLSGDEETVVGHLVFRMCDLIDGGLATKNNGTIDITLKKGDRVIRIGKRTLDLEIVEVRPESPLRGDFLLVYVDLVQGREERAGVGPT